MSRLRGAPADRATAGFYVTGRTGRFRVVEDLAAWMHAPDRGGLGVVTGSPGCGKSAMLALPVLLTDRQRRDVLLARADPGSLLARAADLFDGLPVIGVHARGMNPYQAAGAIAQHLGRSADSPGGLLEDLAERPATSPRIVLVDAVDEARDPQRLLTDLLLPLARRSGLRVVVGARRHVVPAAADISLLVDLDNDGYRDPQALADYAHQLLIAAREPDVTSPYRDRDSDTAVMVAAAIAEKATERLTAAVQAESFLLAQLLARAVRGRLEVLDVTRPGWADQLLGGVGAAFDEDLRLLGNREHAARALLAALAWAKGPGLPWEMIWVPVAQALATPTQTGTLHLDREDVQWLLDNAGAYIVEDRGPEGRSVFRPVHDLIAAHLRGQLADAEAAASSSSADAWQQRREQVEREITRVLLESVPASSDGKAYWELAHPYLRTYLAQHAHAAGLDTLVKLVADLDYLAVADASILTPLLAPTDPALRSVARPYRRARPLLGDSPRDNAAYLQEAVVAQIGSHPVGQRIRATYRTLMARVRRDDSLLTIAGHIMSVLAVAFGVDVGGRPLLASGGGDGTVRLWDPATGTPVGDPLRGHTGPVTSVAFGTGADGRLLLASGSGDQTVRLWDPATGAPVGDPLRGHTDSVRSVTFGIDAESRWLLASGGYDKTVRLWDPVSPSSVGDPLRGHTGLVLSVAFGVDANDRRLLASAAGYDMVRLWDATSRTPVGGLLCGDTGATSVAFGTGADGRPLLACGSGDVWLWDPATGTPVGGPLYGHAGDVITLAFGIDSSGGPLLASGGSDGTVRLWEAGPDPSGPPPWSDFQKALTLLRSGPVAMADRCWPPQVSTARYGCGIRPPAPWWATRFTSVR